MIFLTLLSERKLSTSIDFFSFDYCKMIPLLSEDQTIAFYVLQKVNYDFRQAKIAPKKIRCEHLRLIFPDEMAFFHYDIVPFKIFCMAECEKMRYFWIINISTSYSLHRIHYIVEKLCFISIEYVVLSKTLLQVINFSTNYSLILTPSCQATGLLFLREP